MFCWTWNNFYVDCLNIGEIGCGGGEGGFECYFF
jgi:hypothetical protein